MLELLDSIISDKDACDMMDSLEIQDCITKIDELLSELVKKTERDSKEIQKIFFCIFHASKKYNHKYNEVKKIFVEYCELNKNYVFLVGDQFIIFLKKKSEKEFFLDSFIARMKRYDDKINTMLLLDRLLKKELLDAGKYKVIYADLCCEVVVALSASDAVERMTTALQYYRELGKTSKLDSAILIYHEQVNLLQTQKKRIQIETPPDVIDFLNKRKSAIQEIFRIFSENKREVLNLLTLPVCYNIDEPEQGCLDVVPPIVNPIINDQISLEKLVNIHAFDGLKTVKADMQRNPKMIFRQFLVNSGISVAIESLRENMDDWSELKELILESNIIFEEDLEHIDMALNDFVEESHITFIYRVIPNIEKLLRNILKINGKPDYNNDSSDPAYQSTLTLTGILIKLKEYELLEKSFIITLEEKLNSKEHENYRNRLCHRFDSNIFTEDVANDLFYILLNILFYERRLSGQIEIVGNFDQIKKIVETQNAASVAGSSE